MRYKNIFPAIKNNPKLIYLDSAATTLKPKVVIDSEMHYLYNNGSNPHTTAYLNAFLANEMIVNTRKIVSNFIGAKDYNEIIFNSGTTESLNQIAFGLKPLINNGDEIFITSLEHASNLMPWIKISKEMKANLKIMKLTNNFSIDLDWLKKHITSNTKIVSFAHATNTIGILNNVCVIVKTIREVNPNVIIVLDCAQTVGHHKIDVSKWDVDFIVFSAHKMYGPFGLGILWGKKRNLEQLDPLLYGGGMGSIDDLNLKNIKLNNLPSRFEAGTKNIPAINALLSTINFINTIGLSNIINHEKKLKQYIRKQIFINNLTEKVDFFNLDNDAPLILFKSKYWHSQDVSDFLDKRYNIALRNGAHCAWITDLAFDTHDTIRVSFGIYNTKSDIDVLVEGLKNLDSALDVLFEEN